MAFILSILFALLKYYGIIVNMNIKEILKTKPHNAHYLNRYVRYINACIVKNEFLNSDEYTESHHICPKANDLFPEYNDLKIHTWNSVRLTAHQHIYAHIILWKLYGGSQTFALDWIFKNNSKTNSFLKNRKIPTQIEIRYATLARVEARKLLDETASKFWTGRARYATVDGIYHGSYLHTDSIIKELNLITYRTDAQTEQNTNRINLATKAKLGTNIYNNGSEERFLEAPVDDTWVLGRLTRSDAWEASRKTAAMAKVVGSETWNDGNKNYFFKPDDVIPTHMIKGMKFLDHRTYYYINDCKDDVVEFVGNHIPPQGFNKVKIREYLVVKKKKEPKLLA